MVCAQEREYAGFMLTSIMLCRRYSVIQHAVQPAAVQLNTCTKTACQQVHCDPSNMHETMTVCSPTWPLHLSNIDLSLTYLHAREASKAK